jgi:hypothetical protein
MSFEDKVRVAFLVMFLFTVIPYIMLRIYARGYRDGQGDVLESIQKAMNNRTGGNAP